MLVVLFPNFSKLPNFTKLSLLMRPFDPLGLLPAGGTPAIGGAHSLLRIPHSLEHDEQRDLSRQRKKLHIL